MGQAVEASTADVSGSPAASAAPSVLPKPSHALRHCHLLNQQQRLQQQQQQQQQQHYSSKLQAPSLMQQVGDVELGSSLGSGLQAPASTDNECDDSSSPLLALLRLRSGNPFLGELLSFSTSQPH
ncbi:unnamed protein product [Protopolystoma xenopodis]|uniref:Uncharacterized protein n=1 Tax=Protopolystoma xenopodis TaxID=117903 RepID=A0A448WSK7_9PLAT|nr:unnamed protein product [Protopolystoma xenopodis]